MKKILILSAIILLSIGFCSIASAAGQKLSGYIYSESAGWISLSCANTNSCNSVDYKVFKDNNGKLSGYGYSQNGEWINLNPNYGGVSISSDGSLSGWAFAEKSGWQKVNSAKIISADNLQNQIISAKNAINNNNLSSASAMSLLNSLCSQFLSSSECAIINN